MRRQTGVSFARCTAGLALATALVSPVHAVAQTTAAGPAGDVAVLQVRENVFMLVAQGGNITVQIEPPKTAEPHEGSYNNQLGVLVVDPGPAAMSEKVLAAIRRLSSGAITYIVNTGPDASHAGGNAHLGGEGQSARGGEGGNGIRGASIIAQQNVLARLSGRGSPEENNPNAWPTDAFDQDKAIRFNNEAIQIFHEADAHTDGDSLVFFRSTDVISAGEIFVTDSYPLIDTSRGGNIKGVIDGLNHILDLAVFGDKVEDGTLVIPGHGRLSDYADVNEFRNMVTIIRDRVQALIDQGKTLEQVKAAKPSRQYDKRYSTASWTGDQFVEAVYRGLSKAK